MASTFEQATGGATGNLDAAILVIGDTANTKGYNFSSDGGGDSYIIEATGAIGIILPNGNVAVSQDKTGDVRKFGGISGTDCTVALQAAVDKLNQAFIPKGFDAGCRNLRLKDYTCIIDEGKWKQPDNADFYDSIFINDDTNLGNKNILIMGSGEIDGNAANQTKAPQYLGFLYKSSNCTIEVKTMKGNFAPHNYAGDAPPVHPLSPFDFGVKWGGPSIVDPIQAAILLIAGDNNHVRNFELLDWGREGVVHWFPSNSTTSNFTAINGPESDNEYYEYVDFGSLNLAAAIVVGSNVHADDSHSTGGKPWSIYKSLISGTLDLTAEDYSDVGRWVLVERDISLDNGFTATRMDGAGSFSNSIYDGTAKYCRASSFSIDSELSSIENSTSYHNSFQVAFNFGHAGAPAHNSSGSTLKAINPGWSGGLGGNSYGFNIVAGSKNVMLSDISSVGAGRAGLNVSDNATGAIVNGGNIRYSAAQGVNAFRADISLSGVKATNNISGDFVANTNDPLFPSTLNLSNCEDSNGFISSQQIDSNTVSRTFERSRNGKIYTALRAIFAVTAATAIATIVFSGEPDDDNMLVTSTYHERNTGAAGGASQYVVEETIMVSGSGDNREITFLNRPYFLNRHFSYSWDAGSFTLSIFLTTDGDVDVDASAEENSLFVVAKSNANSPMFIDIGIPL